MAKSRKRLSIKASLAIGVFAKEAALEILNNDYRKAKSAISTCIE
jgi:hypothetical protein